MRRKPQNNNYGQRGKPRNHSGGGGGNRPRKNYSAMREKYLQQARDAQASGDRVLAENYYQHADHCYRMMVEEQNNNPRSNNNNARDDRNNADNQPQHAADQKNASNEGDKNTAAPASAEAKTSVDTQSDATNSDTGEQKAAPKPRQQRAPRQPRAPRAVKRDETDPAPGEDVNKLPAFITASADTKEKETEVASSEE